MKRCLISLVLLLAGSCPMLGQQSADDTASRDDILKLFDVMHIRDQMKQVIDQVGKQMKTMNHEQIRKRDPAATDAQFARLDAMSDRLLRSMPIDGMLDDMIPVYQKHLTKGDVDAMITFYSTPTGQKILGEMPAMATEGMQAMQPRLRKMMDETADKIEKVAEEEETQKQNAKPSDTPK